MMPAPCVHRTDILPAFHLKPLIWVSNLQLACLSQLPEVRDTPVTSTYWVDVDTGFPWQVVHDFGGAAPSTITQCNTPMPDLTIPDPDA